MEWEAAQEWERSWWMSNPGCHWQEIAKSWAVSKLMMIDGADGKKVLDVGCGPFSLLLRIPPAAGVALDPLDFGIYENAYRAAGVRRVQQKAEDFTETGFDEAWIYNCLQHTEDPQAVVRMAARAAKTVRIFEWINIPPYQGHLHKVTVGMITGALAAVPGDLLMHSTGRLNLRNQELDGEFATFIYATT
jgi:SAM-dependent methyltransferase